MLGVSAACAASACTGSFGDDASGSGGSSASVSTNGSGSGAAQGGTSGQGGALDGGVCQRWKADRADMNEGTWTGSLDTCDPGDVSATGRDNALKIANLYRWLADLAPVSHDPAAGVAAQACALIMDKNRSLSHTPPTSWGCYTELGASGAGSSNIATLPGVGAVDLYMIDPGNPTTIGHRRWILSNSLGPIGLGSTSKFSCMKVLGGVGNANKPFTAWPPAGQIPYQVWGVSFQSLDETGWTVQSDSIALAGAKVLLSEDGVERPVDTVELAGGYGSTHALRFNPSGWQTSPGHTYHVVVSGAASPIEYDVEVLDCQ